MKDKQAAVIYRRVTRSRRAWYNSSYTIAGKPIKMLELHYPMIQFLIINIVQLMYYLYDGVKIKYKSVKD